MHLMMAMKQRRSGTIGQYIYLNLGMGEDQQNILANTRAELEGVPV